MTTLICQFNIDSQLLLCPIEVPAEHEADLDGYIAKLDQHSVKALYRVSGELGTIGRLRDVADAASFPSLQSMDRHVITPWLESVYRRLGMQRAQCASKALGAATIAKCKSSDEQAQATLSAVKVLFNVLGYTDNMYLEQLTATAEHLGVMKVHTDAMNAGRA